MADRYYSLRRKKICINCGKRIEDENFVDVEDDYDNIGFYHANCYERVILAFDL